MYRKVLRLYIHFFYFIHLVFIFSKFVITVVFKKLFMVKVLVLYLPRLLLMPLFTISFYIVLLDSTFNFFPKALLLVIFYGGCWWYIFCWKMSIVLSLWEVNLAVYILLKFWTFFYCFFFFKKKLLIVFDVLQFAMRCWDEDLFLFFILVLPDWQDLRVSYSLESL